MPGELAGWRVLRPDLRGHAGGQSAPPGMAQWCGDIARLLDAERCPQAVVAGHCLGANIAAHFAARYPQRIAGAVLIEPMPPEALTGSLKRLRPFRFLFALLGHAARPFHGRVQPMDLEQWDKALEAGELELEEFASPLSDLRYTPASGYFLSVAAVFEPLPERLACPVLGMISKKSSMTDPARTRAAIERLGNARVVELDAEHWIPTEQPAAMRAALEDWLARL